MRPEQALRSRPLQPSARLRPAHSIRAVHDALCVGGLSPGRLQLAPPRCLLPAACGGSAGHPVQAELSGELVALILQGIHVGK